MREDRLPESVARLFRLLAERFDEFAAGDDLAFETLAEQLEEAGYSATDLELAALVLRGVAGAAGVAAPGGSEVEPGRSSLRVWSTEERDSLSPEAWGYLLELKRRGELSPGQFERVMGQLAAIDERPVRVEAAREAASRVVLEHEFEMGETADDGPFDTTH